VTRDDIRRAVLACLSEVAPDADLDSLDPQADMRRELDLDSMDVLNFVLALHRTLAVDIPESEYGRITTLSGCVDLVAAKLRVPQ
jgi:acyl carrier protein